MDHLSRMIRSHPRLVPHLVLGLTAYWFLFILCALVFGANLWGQ